MPKQIRLASSLQQDSIVDGIGLRMVLWMQGCPHACSGCHNMQTWPTTGGFLQDVDTIIADISNRNMQTGITFSGGEPFLQAEALLPIAKACKEKKLNIWAYSGYTFEELLKDPIKQALLQYIDILVDGKFILANKDYRLKFKGSTNQRIIDVQESLRNNDIVLSKYHQDL